MGELSIANLHSQVTASAMESDLVLHDDGTVQAITRDEAEALGSLIAVTRVNVEKMDETRLVKRMHDFNVRGLHGKDLAEDGLIVQRMFFM